MITTRTNYYEILEIASNASIDQIKTAFRKQMMAFHPDKYKGDSEFAKSKTQAIVEAYRVLSKPRSKQIYDLGQDSPLAEMSPKSTQPQQPSKQVQDFFSSLKPRPKRDPNAKPEPGFSLKEFISTYQTLSHYQMEEMEDYLDKNIINLESIIISGHSILKICECHDEDTYKLITRFDAEWLGEKDRFGHLPWLGQFLNTLPVAHWELFLNHMSKKWLQSHLNAPLLLKLMASFSGYNEEKNTEDSSEYQAMKCHTLLTYLGEEWIRQIFRPYALAEVIKEAYYSRTGNHSLVVTFLDGKDNGIQKIIDTGEKLGTTLQEMAEYINGASPLFDSSEPALRSDTKDKWGFFLKYLNKNWREKFIDNPIELNELLNNLCPDNVKCQKKISLFLEIYLDKLKFATFEDLIAVLKPSVEEKSAESKSSSLNTEASLQFINVFDGKQIHEMLLKKEKNLDDLLSKIDEYKNEPFYKALLLGAVKAYRVARAENPDTYTSSWGSTFGYTRDQILDAADSLMKSILTNKPIENLSGMYSGNIGKMSGRYSDILYPVKEKSILSYLLLK